MSSHKLVSVVIPAYNTQKYISHTLDSVLDQSYPHVEIIAVNDGSTDATGSIVESYAAQHSSIRVIRKKNGGLAAARNSGIGAARGEYICIFDSDDLMMPSKIQKQADYLDTHPEIGVAYSDCVHFLDGTGEFRRLDQSFLSEITYERMLHGNYLNPNVVMFRREIYEAVGGFDESLRSSEDWQYWLLLLRRGIRFGYIPEVLTKYRVREDSLTADGVGMYGSALNVLRHELNNSPARFRALITNEINKKETRLMMSYLVCGKRKDAFEIVSKRFRNALLFLPAALVPSSVLKRIYFMSRKKKFMRHSAKSQEFSASPAEI